MRQRVLCVVCLVKDSGQQGTGWVQGRGEGMPKGRKTVVFSFYKGGPVCLHVTQCVYVLVLMSQWGLVSPGGQELTGSRLWL